MNLHAGRCSSINQVCIDQEVSGGTRVYVDRKEEKGLAVCCKDIPPIMNSTAHSRQNKRKQTTIKRQTSNFL
jgi:hypothetical protein